MSNPDEKDKKRKGSSGRPGTKFMERPGVESDAGKDEAQEQAEFAEPEGMTEEEKEGDRWNAAGPRPKEPGKKSDQDEDSGKEEGKDQEGEEGMGKEE